MFNLFKFKPQNQSNQYSQTELIFINIVEKLLADESTIIHEIKSISYDVYILENSKADAILTHNESTFSIQFLQHLTINEAKISSNCSSKIQKIIKQEKLQRFNHALTSFKQRSNMLLVSASEAISEKQS